MPVFHHGVETVELDSGVRPVREVRTAVIGLVGIAPEGPSQELTLVRSKADAAQFGKQVPGYTIPQALDAIFKQGNALVVVVNVANPNDHYVWNDISVVQNEVVTIAGGTGQLARYSVPDAVFQLTSMDGLTVYDGGGMDYLLDDTDWRTLTLYGLPDGQYKATYRIYELADVENMKFSTEYAPLAGTVELYDGFSGTLYQAGIDYTYDSYGNFKIVNGGGITEGDSLQVHYRRLDVTLVAAGDLVGEYAPSLEARSGMFLFELCYNSYGFKPKLIHVPVFNHMNAVWTEMLLRAEQFRGIALLDSASGWTVSDALEARGPLSTANFGTGSKRAYLFYPGVQVQHPDTGEIETRPMSSFAAGLIASVDVREGYWTSPSNHEVLGVLALETDVTWDFQALETQANALNEVGITTMGKPYGSGFRLWGNRSAAFPTDTAPDNFVSVRRTADTLHESVELAMLPFIDRPITNAVIASIKETVNSYIRLLIQRGALVSGECRYDPAKNPPVQVAAGQLVFDLDFMPPTPAERITFESFINIERLAALGS